MEYELAARGGGECSCAQWSRKKSFSSTGKACLIRNQAATFVLCTSGCGYAAGMPWTAICYCNIYWCGGKGTLARLGFPSMHAAHPVSRGWRMHFGVAQGGRAATLMRLGSHSPPLATSLPRWLGHTAPRWRRAKPPRPRTPQRVGKSSGFCKASQRGARAHLLL